MKNYNKAKEIIGIVGVGAFLLIVISCIIGPPICIGFNLSEAFSFGWLMFGVACAYFVCFAAIICGP